MKKKYYALVREFHPDKRHTETGFGVERTKEFNEAYDVSRRTLTHVALVVLPPAKQCLG